MWQVLFGKLPLLKLEGTARYTGLVLAPANCFGFGKKCQKFKNLEKSYEITFFSSKHSKSLKKILAKKNVLFLNIRNRKHLKKRFFFSQNLGKLKKKHFCLPKKNSILLVLPVEDVSFHSTLYQNPGGGVPWVWHTQQQQLSNIGYVIIWL